jgi:hypothetical protein
MSELEPYRGDLPDGQLFVTQSGKVITQDDIDEWVAQTQHRAVVLPGPPAATLSWLLLGLEQRGSPLVLATSDLAGARFTRRVDGVKRIGLARVPDVVHAVGAEFRQFTQIRGASYAECLQTLRTRWNPPA